MILLWMTFLVLHQAYSLAPVISVQLGEPVTFTCALPNSAITNRQFHWYKQSAGDVLKIVLTQVRMSKPVFIPEFESRFEVAHDEKFTNLTIVKTTEEDEGMYLCEISDWLTHPVWTGTYLLVKGNTQKTSNYTVVQSLTGSDPGDSVTLQCSIFSDHKNKTCPGDHGVYWFRAGSDKSHPDLIYTQGNECEKGSDSLKSCVYRFSKSVSSSDAGIYHCAVATCGEIIFGNETKLLVSDTGVPAVSLLLCVVLALSLIVIIFLICGLKKSTCDCSNAVALQKQSTGQKTQQRDENTMVYSAVVFTLIKSDSGGLTDVKSTERVRIYAALKAFGLD